MFVILMQNNPNVAPYRNGLPMLHLYQDIFEGQSATSSFAYHYISTYVRPGQSDDVPLEDEDNCAEETMNTFHFCPSMNTSSRSIGKGKSTRRRNPPMWANLVIDTLRELVNKVGGGGGGGGDGDGDGDEVVVHAQSSMSVLDKSALILQEVSLEAGMYAYLLDYLLKNPNLQSMFNNMNPNLRMQWVHIITALPPPSYAPHVPPSF